MLFQVWWRAVIIAIRVGFVWRIILLLKLAIRELHTY